MKKKCVVCIKTRGKRGCKINENELICSKCCAEIRGEQCEGCPHYQTAQRYTAEKIRKSQSTKEHFITEIYPEIDDRIDHALELIENGNNAQGEEIIDKLLPNYPKSHTVNYAKGVVYLQKNQWDKAIQYFDKATEIFPYFVEAHYNKGAAYQQKVDIKNMLRAYRKVVYYGNPDDMAVRRANSVLSDMERNVSKHHGVDLDRYLEAQDLFEIGHDSMTNNDFEKAIANYEKSIKIIDNLPQPYGNLGICYAKVGRKQEALEALNRALEIDPNYEPAMANKVLVEELADDAKLVGGEVKSIEYYKDYPLKRRSYLKEWMQNFFH